VRRIAHNNNRIPERLEVEMGSNEIVDDKLEEAAIWLIANQDRRHELLNKALAVPTTVTREDFAKALRNYKDESGQPQLRPHEATYCAGWVELVMTLTDHAPNFKVRDQLVVAYLQAAVAPPSPDKDPGVLGG